LDSLFVFFKDFEDFPVFAFFFFASTCSNNMDLVRDTAAKIVRIHELEAENKRLRDSVKKIEIEIWKFIVNKTSRLIGYFP
jgi:hypothetical protein